MNRMVRALLSSVVAAAILLAPTAAGASDENSAYAVNVDDGTAVVDASVQFRVVANGMVDQTNTAYAAASCVDCQAVAAAFQIVLVKNGYDTLEPYNEAFGANVDCDRCISWASAKQIIVVSDDAANITSEGRKRLRALEDSIEAMQPELPSMSLTAVQARLNAAFAELLDIAQTEIRLGDDGPQDGRVEASFSS
jgi:putative peptide zinc metalloprotease protein